MLKEQTCFQNRHHATIWKIIWCIKITKKFDWPIFISQFARPSNSIFWDAKNYNEILIAIIIFERHRHLLLDRFDCIVIILAKNTPRTASL